MPRTKTAAPKRTQAGTRKPPPVRRSTRLLLVGSAVVSALILVAWFPAGSLYRQQKSLASATAQLHQLHQEDAALTQERKNLSDTTEIARIAREQYQLVSAGQQAFEVLPPSGTAPAGAPYAGDPGHSPAVVPSAGSELPPGGGQQATQTGASSSGSTNSQGTLQRMLRALEFWR
ncbi:MAG TPA: septum formation initiator family protein [Acidimicrobiales bacterium]|nr:septum formation initiator family protein [Acidimicrobiales bacterium]